MDNVHQLARTLRPHVVRWGPIVVAAVYLVFWLIGESGRMTGAFMFIPLALFTVTIALSGRLPLVSLTLALLIPLLQLVGIVPPPTANNWFMYGALGLVAFIVALGAQGWARRLVLPVGAVVAALFAARLVLPSSEGTWTEWIGGPYAPRLNPVNPVREDFTVLLLGAIVFYVAFWALGTAARALLSERALGGVLFVAEARLEETDFELRLSQDRARISRDVHDTLAHSLAVIVSQAEGAIALKGKRPAVAGEALANIASVGRSALLDVRKLVESIHDHDITTSTPTIGDIQSLIAHLRDVGMDVSLRVLGSPRPLAPSPDLAVFRIVQESLTNALRHSGQQGSARITLDWQGTGLAVLVSSIGTNPPPATSRGVGIEGMKERARLSGGWLTAEPADDGSFVVTAYIPTPALAPVPSRLASDSAVKQELADA